VANSQAASLFGYTRAELIGRPAVELFPEPPDGYTDGHGPANWFGHPAGALLLVSGRRHDGAWFPVEVTVSTVTTRTPTLATLTIRDLTDHERDAAAMAHAGAIIASTGDAVMSATLDGRIASWNHGAERIYGYTAEEAIGRQVTLLSPPGLAAEFEAVTAAWREGAGVVDFETVRRRKDGTLVDVSITLTAVFDANGTPIGGSSITRDISERKRQQSALRDAEELLVLAFDHSPLGMTISGPDLGIIKINQAFAAMLGYNVDELLAAPDLAQSPIPGDRTADEQNVSRLLSGEADVTQWDKRYQHRDGHLVWARVSVSALRNPDATVRSLVGQVEDISERRAMEKQLRNLADRDPLTGLWNRRIFDESLAAQILRCRLAGETAALLMIDLDGFKQINDTHGHAAGDELLKGVADAIHKRVRATDLAARLGGDEFAVLLAHTTPETVAAAIAAIEQAICGVSVTAQTAVVHPRASVGAANIDQETVRPQDVLEQADRAMYAAKLAHRSADSSAAAGT